MATRMRWQSRLLLPLHFLLLLFSLFSGCSPQQYYADCHPPFLFRCGWEEFNVSYPFTAAGRNQDCSYGEYYNLTCVEDIPAIQINRRLYRVTRIDYEADVLSIVDIELAKEACRRPSGNVTLDWSLFEYTGDRFNLTLHYNCTPVTLPSPPLREVPCLALPGRASYFTVDQDPLEPRVAGVLGSCSSTFIVPLRRAAANSGSASIGRAVKEGFDVRWKAGNSWCRGCVESGGACGHSSGLLEVPKSRENVCLP